MRHYRTILLLIIIFSCCLESFARISTEQEIKQMARELEKQAHGQYDCYGQGRYLIFESYVTDNTEISKFTKDSVIDHIDDHLAAICATNFIGVKYICHYTDNSGNKRSKTLTINPLELLNMSGNSRENVSLKEHPKSLGVNIELVKPKGWDAKEGNGQHIVKRYEAGTVYYYFQINEMSTFVSKKEAEELFNEKSSCDELVDEFLSGFSDCKIYSRTAEMVNRYPALHLRFTYSISKLGLEFPIYANIWIIPYEDKMVIIWGATMSTEQSEQHLFDSMFTMLVNQVRFPDQFN